MAVTKSPIAAIALCAALMTGAAAGGALAQSLAEAEERAAEIDRLLEELAQPDLRTWEATEQKIIGLWSRSGSETADFMLSRAQDLIAAEEYETAIEHLTALTDHAPDFAEGWYTRATAFYMIDEYGLAMHDLERALALNPQHFGALTGLGTLLEEVGDLPLALRVLRLARDLNPHREETAEAIRRLEFRIGEATL